MIREHPTDLSQLDAPALETELKTHLEGEVRFDPASRGLYSTDASNYRQVPVGVVLPKTEADVIETVRICHDRGVPILSRGGGTSLAGQCCNVAVVMDFSKYMNQILELNAEEKYAWVQPGLVLDDLRDRAEQHHLTFGPDPATHNHCTLGGMMGNNSCGIHALMAGKTVDNVLELDILTYDGLRLRVGATSADELEQIIAEGGQRGDIYARMKALRDQYADLIRQRYPDIPRRVSGYNLDQLLPENGFNVARALIGSEGTLVTILRAKVKLVDSPPSRTLVVLGYDDVYSAGDHVPDILEFAPIGLEGIDHHLIEYMEKKGLNVTDLNLLPDGKGWLLVEFGGENKQAADHNANRMIDALKKLDHAPNIKRYDDPNEEQQVWEIRESGLGATAHIPGMNTTHPGWEDAAIPPTKVGQYLRDFRALLERYDYACALYGHFGQGCIHVRIDFDLRSQAGVAKYLNFISDAADLVNRYGGSFSGEHGDGQSRAALLPKMFGAELIQAFNEFKSIWDAAWKLNPGKVVDPYPPDANLREGPAYDPWEPETYFHYPDDHDQFSEATLRCVGVGKCRREDGGTMCPSYMVTREEQYSTRGRSRLLFEMLQGDVVKDRWHDEGVKDALDLCLACKGCKGDCPVNVDMATYKAEFLSHYYEGRLRPMTAYSMGLIYGWARIATRIPRLANFVTHAPILKDISKAIMGIAPQRAIPNFARELFTHWFSHRPPRNVSQPQVMLWPDTFNNYFFPDVCQAAVAVLEDAGYQVIVPQRSLCCGRPVYDWGMLGEAQKLWQYNMQILQPQIDEGTPIVGLEPSCVAAFRDELVNLYPDNSTAQHLSQHTFMLSEFLMEQVDNYQPPQVDEQALVHGHCHHKAIMGMQAETDLLQAMGLDFELLNSGCCGMAGAFGFEKDHYDISVKAGERVLLPRVRAADTDTLIIADGFSCREQIVQTTQRKALHVAQVMRMALQANREIPAHERIP